MAIKGLIADEEPGEFPEAASEAVADAFCPGKGNTVGVAVCCITCADCPDTAGADATGGCATGCDTGCDGGCVGAGELEGEEKLNSSMT
jgi:hypothetical protein